MIDVVIYISQSGELLIDYLKNVFNFDVVQDVEQMICGQIENELWFKYRYGRIIFLLFLKVCYFRGKSYDNYIICEIFNDKFKVLNINVIMYGRQNEIIVK